MKQIQEALEEADSGPGTKFLGDEVIHEIDRLLLAMKEALDRARQEQEQQQQQQQQQQPPPGRKRMVPPVAELIMLKDMQVNVNKKTRVRRSGEAGRI